VKFHWTRHWLYSRYPWLGLETNDSKWLNSSCDSTQPSHDSTL